MPIRIYSLAKQLKVDSKELVEVCNRAGVPGKGSALASLSDEEADRVRQYLQGGSDGDASGDAGKSSAEASGQKTGGGDTAMRREDYVPPAGAFDKSPPVTLKRRAESPSSSKSESQADSESSAPPSAEGEAPGEKAPAAAAPTAPPSTPAPAVAHGSGVAPSPPTARPAAEASQPPSSAADSESDSGDRSSSTGSGALPAALRRKRSRGALTPLGAKLAAAKGEPARRDEDQDESEADRGKTRPQATPQIRLAAMPFAPGAAAPKAKAEPAPQRPEMKLPADAMRPGKLGAKPLSEHLKKHEERRRSDADVGDAPPSESGRGSRRRAGHAEQAEDRSSLAGRDLRQLNRKRAAASRRRRRDDDDDSGPSRSLRRVRRKGQSTAAPRKGDIVVELPCTVRTLSEAAGVGAGRILGKLLQMGSMANINSAIDEETAEFLAMELGLDVQFRAAQTVEEEWLEKLDAEDDLADLEPRPPVVTVLGHVDHGKTTLLDRIIGIDVAGGESGGITQHIRAYSVEKDGKRISFVDTPGHEAFTEMRARGANVTDIAVIVIAADDGIMPQTEEAISHARAAGAPIVIAVNKIDLPGVDINRVFQQLASNELLPSEWGGDTEVVKTSALTGDGVDDLLETILTIAELHEYKANPNRAASGVCLEAELHEGRGVVSKLIVQRGTLKVGDAIVCGASYGRVKSMRDTLKDGVVVEAAGPSMPVNVAGLDVAPNAGDRFHVVEDVAVARDIAETRGDAARAADLSATPAAHVTLENLFDRLEGGSGRETLNVIIRTDVRGSIEAILKEFEKLEHPEVQIRVLQKSVGGITEADVMLAHASDAIVIGFNVVPDEGARSLAERCGVQIRRYSIIYKLTEDLKAALEGLLEPEQREVELGRALVQQVYHNSKIGAIAGCRVMAGTMERGARCRVIRDSRILGDYLLDSLRREKDDAKEVREGLECGIKLSGFNDVKEADILEAFRIEEFARTL